MDESTTLHILVCYMVAAEMCKQCDPRGCDAPMVEQPAGTHCHAGCDLRMVSLPDRPHISSQTTHRLKSFRDKTH